MNLARSAARPRLWFSPGWQIGLGLLLLSLILIVHFIWLALDARPPAWDTAIHAIATLDLMRLPWAGQPGQALAGLVRLGPYPPLTYLVAGLYGQLLTPGLDSFLAANAFFLVVLAASVFGLGRRWGGTSAGLLAAGLVSFYPIIYSHARYFLLDVPLTAMVALILLLALSTDGFARRDRSLALGLALGAGLLTKWTCVVFAGPPLLLLAAAALRRPDWRRRLLHGLLALGVGALVCGPWYGINFERLAAFARSAGRYIAQLEGDPIGTWRAWFYYPHQLLEQQLFLPLTLLFLLSLPLFWRRFRLSQATLILTAWLIVPYVAFSLFANKDPRYTIPLLPAMALITALGLAQLRRPVWRRWGAALLLGYLLLQFAGLSFGLSQRLPAGWLPARVQAWWLGLPLVLYAENVTFATPPQAGDWPEPAVLAEVLAAAPAGLDRPVRLLVMTNQEFFELHGFRYFAALNRQDILFDTVIGTEPDPIPSSPRLAAADFVITKTGPLGPAWTVGAAPALRDELLATGRAAGHRFNLWRTFPLPDGSYALLYRRPE